MIHGRIMDHHYLKVIFYNIPYLHNQTHDNDNKNGADNIINPY